MKIILTFVVKATHNLYLSFHSLSFYVKCHYGNRSESKKFKTQQQLCRFIVSQALNISESIIFIMMKHCP